MENSFICVEKIYDGIFSQITKVRWNSQVVAHKKVSSIFGRYANPIEGYVSQLKHPNIISGLHAYYDIDHLSFNLMMPIASFSMDKIYHKKISSSRMLNLVRQILLGVLFLHQNHIVHGDIKPSNILYFTGDIVKISDFGMSVLLLNDDDLLYNMAYTLQYRPYEVWSKTGWNYSADMWALGCTLFEIYYGRCLFPYYKNKDYCQTQHDWFTKKYHDKVGLSATYSLPEDWNRDENREFNSLLQRMLVRKPDSIWDVVNDPLLGLSIIPKRLDYSWKDMVTFLIESGGSIETAEKIISVMAGRDGYLTDDEARLCNRLNFQFVSKF